jgi:hypothetical protein
MPSYYEALPIFRTAMDSAVRVDRAVLRFPKGHENAHGRELANRFEHVALSKLEET